MRVVIVLKDINSTDIGLGVDEHAGTNRMYECTSLITPDMVKEKCEELIGEINGKS